MAGLGSFVEGFVGGVDTGNKWADRKRQITLDAEDRKWLNENRDWARGDRTYTVEERERLRAEQDRVMAEQKAEREAQAAAWAATQEEAAAAAANPPDQATTDPRLGDMGAGQGGFSFAGMGDPMAPGRSVMGMTGPAGMPSAGPAPIATLTAAPTAVPFRSGATPATVAPPMTEAAYNSMTYDQQVAAVESGQWTDMVMRMATGAHTGNKPLTQMPGADASNAEKAAWASNAAAREQERLDNEARLAKLDKRGRTLLGMDGPQPAPPAIGAQPTASPTAPAGRPSITATAAPGTGAGTMTQAPPPANLQAATGSAPPRPTITAPTAPASAPPSSPAAASAGRSALSFNNPATTTPERADKAVKSTLDHYMNVGVPKMIDHYMSTGQFAKAQAMDKWAKDTKSQASMELWAKGLHSYAIGDEKGMLDNFAEYYNSLGMGVTVDRKKSSMTRDAAGNVTGVEVAFVDKSGKTTIQNFDGVGDLLQEGIMGMQPDKMFELMYDQQSAAQVARSKSQQLEVSVQIATMRLKSAGINSDPAMIAKVAAQIAAADMTGSFFEKSPEEQGQMIADALAGQDYAESIRSGAAIGAQGGGDALPMMD